MNINVHLKVEIYVHFINIALYSFKYFLLSNRLDNRRPEKYSKLRPKETIFITDRRLRPVSVFIKKKEKKKKEI